MFTCSAAMRAIPWDGVGTYSPAQDLSRLIAGHEALQELAKDWANTLRPLFQHMDSLKLDAANLSLDPQKLSGTRWVSTTTLKPLKVLAALQGQEKGLLSLRERSAKLSDQLAPLMNQIALTFPGLRDSPTHLMASSLLAYDTVAQSLRCVPFAALPITGPTTFLSLTDTPGALTSNKVIRVNAAETALEEKSFGTISTQLVTRSAQDNLPVSSVLPEGGVLQVDSAGGDRTILLDPILPGSRLLVTRGAAGNQVHLQPSGATLNGGGLSVTLSGNQLSLIFLNGDYRSL